MIRTGFRKLHDDLSRMLQLAQTPRSPSASTGYLTPRGLKPATRITRNVACLITALGIVGGAGGCQLLVNPYVDEFATRPAVTTLSAEEARTAQVTPTSLERGHGPYQVRTKDGLVTHGPLYFEDPFEDEGSEDGQYAWTGDEYLCLVYGPGRYLLNGVLFPASVVVDPPWTLMASDGRLSRKVCGMDHDAEQRTCECPEG